MAADEGSGSEITRRRFVRDAGVATAVAVDLLASPARAAQAGRRRTRRPTVAVFGGGVGGLTAAHELAERGFDVTVYERRAFGGKARSMDVAGSARGGRRPLPGEHGPRLIFGGYQHVPDTMRRIPFDGNTNGVFDNLIEAPLGMIVRDGGRANLVLPESLAGVPPLTPVEAIDTVISVFQSLPADETVQFVRRLAVFLSSGDARRRGEWERVSWSDFLQCSRFSDSYRKVWGDVFTRFASASKAETESARCAGEAFESVAYLPLTARGHTRILNLPTSEAWIDPWLTLLGGLDVRMANHHELVALGVRDGAIVGARVRGPAGTQKVQADWYVCALPVERATRIWSRAILAADPGLARAARIMTRWMNGIQYYLREPTPIVPGPVLHVDSPWGIGAFSQAQFWGSRNFARDYGDGQAREDLSAFITDATTPGILFGKTAQQCTAGEIAREVWEQMKRGLNDSGRTVLSDDLLHSWHLDPGLVRADGRWQNEDQLWISTPGSLYDLPAAATAIPNLFLASSYVRTNYIDVDCMETANEGGRRAVNALLAQAGSSAAPAHIFERQMPVEWQALRELDDRRYARGEPNLLDTDMTLGELKSVLGGVGNLVGLHGS